MNYTGSFSLNSLGLGQSGLMQAYQTGMTAQSDATGYKPFAYNPDSGKVRRPRQGDPAVDSFQRYLEASMANNLPSYPLSNPFNHAAHYRNVVYTAVSSMMRVLSSASIRLEIKRDGKGGMASVAGDSRDHDYVEFKDHYLSDFLRSPNPADDFASFLGKCILQYHLTGRLLIWGVPNKWGLPVRFYVLPTALCIPNPGVPTDRYPMGAWRIQNYYPSSGMVGILPGPAAGIASTPGALIDAREIYVMNNPHPLFNWASLSGLDAMGVQTDVVEMMDKAFWSVYRQGPRIAGILTAPGATADQIDDLNSAINSTYAGPDNAGKIWTTGGRVDAPSFTPISLGPEQLDITARATYEAQIIAAVTGQDRTVLGLKTDGVGSYSERWAAMADVRERTYIPWLGMLASMLTRGPVRDWGLEDKGVRVAIRLPRLNDPVMVQADTNAGAADGTMTTDEVRARRDMGPDPLGLGHLPPAIRTMTLQLAAEQGGLPPNPTPPGDDGSEETVDIADPSDDGTALGALRASREEPEGEPIASTAQVEAAQQARAKTGQPRKPAGSSAGKKSPKPKPKTSGGGKGPPIKKAITAPDDGDDLARGVTVLYHETPAKNIDSILTNGLRQNPHMRSPKWYTLTDSLPGAINYTSGATDRHVVEIHLPPDAMDRYVWPKPGASDHYGNQYAVRGTVPAEYIRAVHAPDDNGEFVRQTVGEHKALPENPEHRTEAVYGLHLALQADPLNHGLRQVYADALDDVGASHEATVHRAIAVAHLHGDENHPEVREQFHGLYHAADPELSKVASHIAHEYSERVVDHGNEYGPVEHLDDVLGGAAYRHASRANQNVRLGNYRQASLEHGWASNVHGEAADEYAARAAYRNSSEALHRHGHALNAIAEAANRVARTTLGTVPEARTIKSDIAQSAFTDSLGGTLVPAAGSATVPTKKKRRVLRGHEAHDVIERAVADVLGVPAAVEAKAELADPDPVPAFDRYAAHRKHLATLPVVGSSPLGNPVDHSNVSHLITLQHPRRQIKAVFKPSEGEQPGLRQHIPMHAGAQAARESAASHVAQIAGYHDLVPATTLRHHEGQHGSVQRFVGDGILAAKLGHEERFGSNHHDVRRAAAFDYLIGNTDRHLGNWLVRPTPHGDKITLIDHGLAFPDKHPTGAAWHHEEMIRRTYLHRTGGNDPPPNPGGSDPDGKWLAIRRTLTEHGLSSKAIADTGKRWRVLTSGRFHFGELLSEHPDYLIGKLNTASTRSGV